MMNDLEINGMAEGLAKYVMEKTESPVEGTAVLGIACIVIFANSSKPGYSIEKFADDFKQGLIDTYNKRSHVGPGTIQ